MAFTATGTREQNHLLSKETRSSFSSFRNLVKPFLLKCHPDVQPSDDLASKRINLRALQNLNSYLDTVQSVLSGKPPRRQPDSNIVEVDFVLWLDDGNDDTKDVQSQNIIQKKKKHKDTKRSSRRKVQLLLPPWDDCQSFFQQDQRKDAKGDSENTSSLLRQRLHSHVVQELARLLKVAGLSIPASAMESFQEEESWDENIGDHDDDDHRQQQHGRRGLHRAPRLDPFARTRRRGQDYYLYKSEYEQSRDRFTSRLDWSKFDKIYNRAVADMEADLATEGLISNSPSRRRHMISSMLAAVRLEEGEITFTEQLIAFRRLSLLLQDHFETLHLDDFGHLWEERLGIVLTAARSYNTSASALHRRRKRHNNDNDGFSFTLHPDYRVTMRIPVDFRDDELIRELDKNLWDFYNLVADGVEEQLHPDYKL